MELVTKLKGEYVAYFYYISSVNVVLLYVVDYGINY